MIHTLNPDCDADFACAECGRVVCTENEIALCICRDEPCCDNCCEREHA